MTTSRKILRINTALNIGGAAQKALALHNSLNKGQRFSDFFAYGRGEKVNNTKREFRFAWQFEVYLQFFLSRMTGLQGYGSYLSTKRLEKFILNEKFDLIHLHNLHGYYLDLSFISFLGRLAIPVVWTLHDGWAVTGRCAYLFECDYWRNGCGDCPNLSWYPKTYVDISALMWKRKKRYLSSQWNPVIVCPSQWLADKIKEAYLNKFRIEVIHNGVDTEVFKPKNRVDIRRKLGIEPNRKVILLVAKNLKDERKGTKYFFESLKHIRHLNCIVITIGENVDLDTELAATSDIRQVEYITDKNLLSDFYNAADIYCITTLDDNFPTTVLEALSCGTAVVAFKVGGIVEQVTEDCGILVEPKDTNALSMALQKLLADTDIRSRFETNCRNRALEHYSLDKFQDQHIKLYNELLE